MLNVNAIARAGTRSRATTVLARLPKATGHHASHRWRRLIGLAANISHSYRCSDRNVRIDPAAHLVDT